MQLTEERRMELRQYLTPEESWEWHRFYMKHNSWPDQFHTGAYEALAERERKHLQSRVWGEIFCYCA